MIILAEGAPPSFERNYADNPHVGHLLTPRSLNVKQVLESGLPWGVDCESVRGFEEDRFLRLVVRLHDAVGCRFFAVPPWCAYTANAAKPWALVIGPGNACDYDSLIQQEALGLARKGGFVLAGNARWRQENQALAMLVNKATKDGLWIHARDVCSFRQARSMANLGCNSCSLPHYGRFNYTKFEPLMEAAQQAAAEPSLFGGT